MTREVGCEVAWENTATNKLVHSMGREGHTGDEIRAKLCFLRVRTSPEGNTASSHVLALQTPGCVKMRGYPSRRLAPTTKMAGQWQSCLGVWAGPNALFGTRCVNRQLHACEDSRRVTVYSKIWYFPKDNRGWTKGPDPGPRFRCGREFRKHDDRRAKNPVRWDDEWRGFIGGDRLGKRGESWSRSQDSRSGGRVARCATVDRPALELAQQLKEGVGQRPSCQG